MFRKGCLANHLAAKLKASKLPILNKPGANEMEDEETVLDFVKTTDFDLIHLKSHEQKSWVKPLLLGLLMVLWDWHALYTSQTSKCRRITHSPWWNTQEFWIDQRSQLPGHSRPIVLKLRLLIWLMRWLSSDESPATQFPCCLSPSLPLHHR